MALITTLIMTAILAANTPDSARDMATTAVIDPVTTEASPLRLLPLDGQAAEEARALVRAELCEADAPCPYAFGTAEEIAGSMCWNEATLGQAVCRGAVAGLRVDTCHVDTDGSSYDCWYYEIMEGAISTALAGDPRLAGHEVEWISRERGDNAFYEIETSAYCADPPQGACTRLYNAGVILGPDGYAGVIFEHCWDDAEAGLARCRQAIIGAADED